MRLSKVANSLFIAGILILTSVSSVRANTNFESSSEQTSLSKEVCRLDSRAETEIDSSGVLSESDLRLDDNTPYDSWRFTIPARRRVTINMTSSVVDAYLLLFNSSGDELARNDDSGSLTDEWINANSQIRMVLEPGTYIALANSVRHSSNLDIPIYGRYQLSVDSRCIVRKRSTRGTLRKKSRL